MKIDDKDHLFLFLHNYHLLNWIIIIWCKVVGGKIFSTIFYSFYEDWLILIACIYNLMTACNQSLHNHPIMIEQFIL